MHVPNEKCDINGGQLPRLIYLTLNVLPQGGIAENYIVIEFNQNGKLLTFKRHCFRTSTLSRV